MFNLPPTGHMLVDALQRSQLEADLIPTFDTKLQHVSQRVHEIGRIMLGERFLVTAHDFFLKEPDAPQDRRLLIPHELLLIAELDEFSYMCDPDLPLDSLLLSFTGPDSIELSPADADEFRKSTVQIPILNIDECKVA